MEKEYMYFVFYLGILLGSFYLSFYFYSLYKKLEKASYENFIYRNFYLIQNAANPLRINQIENFLENFNNAIKKSNLNPSEVNILSEKIFNLVEIKLVDRIMPVMNITGAAIPSLGDLFPENHYNPHVNFLESRESVIKLIEEYNLFLELTKKEKSEIFENKINLYMPSILDSIIQRMDVEGRNDIVKLSYRVHSIMCMIRTLAGFSCIKQGTLSPYLYQLDMIYKKLNKKEYNEGIYNSCLSVEEIEKDIFQN